MSKENAKNKKDSGTEKDELFIFDLTGRSREGLKFMIISANEFQQLSDKTAEVLQEAALAYERIAKDRQEIEQLKTETRALLARLRAA